MKKEQYSDANTSDKIRNSFVFYRSYFEAISDLSPDVRLELYDAISQYSLNFEKPKLTGIAKTIFYLIAPQIEANHEKFHNGLKGAEYGAKGGRPKNNLSINSDSELRSEDVETKNLRKKLSDRKSYLRNIRGFSESQINVDPTILSIGKELTNYLRITPVEPQNNPSRTPNVNVNANTNVKETINIMNDKKEKECVSSFESMNSHNVKSLDVNSHFCENVLYEILILSTFQALRDNGKTVHFSLLNILFDKKAFEEIIKIIEIEGKFKASFNALTLIQNGVMASYFYNKQVIRYRTHKDWIVSPKWFISSEDGSTCDLWQCLENGRHFMFQQGENMDKMRSLSKTAIDHYHKKNQDFTLKKQIGFNIGFNKVKI